MRKITAYHGTGAASSRKILQGNFSISRGDSYWLGDGAYFFMDDELGFDGIECAKKWANVHAYDRNDRKYKYQRYAVVKARISVPEEEFLDLTSADGMEVFNYLRERYLEAVKAAGKRLNRNSSMRDGYILNLARANFSLKLSVVKAHFYIRFAVEQTFNVRFRIPNSTTVAVFDPNSCIDPAEVEIISEDNLSSL